MPWVGRKRIRCASIIEIVLKLHDKKINAIYRICIAPPTVLDNRALPAEIAKAKVQFIKYKVYEVKWS